MKKAFEPKKIAKPADTMERIANAVKGNFLFSKLSQSDLNVVRDAMFEMKYRQHDVIIQQGEEGDNFYVIESGEVNVFVSKQGEKRQKVASFGPGKSFGELALMYVFTSPPAQPSASD
jgi:cAMP-dependent protein kinase regulator